MEQDIKILEEFVEELSTQYLDRIVCDEGELLKAIQNLILGYKHYEKLLANKIINEDFKELYIKLRITIKDEYVPKYKVKELIEKIKNSKENYTFEKLTSEDIRRTIITNLEELL